MKNTIGKVVLFLIINMCSIALLGVSVSMHITDMTSKETDEVGVGVPFQVRIMVKDATSSNDVPEIVHDKGITLRKAGVQFFNVNGKTSASHLYVGVASVPNRYTIGPATVKIGGTVFSSEPRVITASLQQGVPVSHGKGNRKQNNQDEPFVRLIIDQKELYLGQKATCSLKFFAPTQGEQIHLQQLHIPQLNGIKFEQKGSQNQGVELINQKPFSFIEWQFDVVPYEIGQHTIPSFSIDYQKEDDDMQSLYGGFSLMFGAYVPKRIYANSDTITVIPVPLYKNKSVDAVGNFTELKAKVTPEVIPIGEAVTLTLTLIGSGNFESIKHPSLHNIPSTVTVYESQSRIEKTGNQNEYMKQFEYVLQAREAGSFKIEKQSLVAFDPTTRTHYILKTKPMTFMVQQSQHMDHRMKEKKTLTGQDGSKEYQEKKEEKVDSEARHIKNDCTLEWMTHDVHEKKIPDSLFWYGIYVLLLLILLYILFHQLYFPLLQIWYYVTAYYRARKALFKAEENGMPSLVLDIFKKFIFQRTKKYNYLIDHEVYTFIATIITEEQERRAWHIFYEQMIEYTYTVSDRSISSDPHNHFWKNAHRWLRMIKGV